MIGQYRKEVEFRAYGLGSDQTIKCQVNKVFIFVCEIPKIL